MLPILYLDVDGVLNPDGKRQDGRAWDDLKKHRIVIPYSDVQGGKYNVWLSPSMGAALAALPVELRYLTSWGKWAPVAIGPHIGLPSGMPVVGDYLRTFDDPKPPWKADAVKAQVAVERRPFIWIDDEDITPDFSAWASACGVPALPLLIDGWTGITPDHIVQVKAFLELVNSAS